jgi:hypothetical protein
MLETIGFMAMSQVRAKDGPQQRNDTHCDLRPPRLGVPIGARVDKMPSCVKSPAGHRQVQLPSLGLASILSQPACASTITVTRSGPATAASAALVARSGPDPVAVPTISDLAPRSGHQRQAHSGITWEES